MHKSITFWEIQGSKLSIVPEFCCNSIGDVPAGVFPQCSKKIVKADAGQWITKLIKNSERIAKAPRISVP